MFQSSMAEHASEFLRRLPPIGLAREQTEAWRELAAAHAECRRMEHELRSVLAKVQLDALDLLERRLLERDPKHPIASFRELYDLWVECGEQVYGKLAHSAAYSKLQAELGNASMRLRSRVQAVLEHGLKQFDLPTRSELNTLHRQVRELRLQVEQLQTALKMDSRVRGNDGPAVEKDFSVRGTDGVAARNGRKPSRKGVTSLPTSLTDKTAPTASKGKSVSSSSSRPRGIPVGHKRGSIRTKEAAISGRSSRSKSRVGKAKARRR